MCEATRRAGTSTLCNTLNSPCMQDIKDQTLVHSTAAQRTWEDIGSNTECDAGAGEVYHMQSSSKVSDLAACKKSCEESTDGCQSITFFDNGWCSHFSTSCMKTKLTSKVISMRLIGAQPTTASSTRAGELILLVRVGSVGWFSLLQILFGYLMLPKFW